MADALSDFVTLTRSLGNFAQSLSQLNDIRVQEATAFHQMELNRKFNDFAMRMSLAPGSDGRIWDENFDDEFGKLNQEVDDGLATITDKAVRYGVEKNLSPMAESFKFKIAAGMGQARTRDAQAYWNGTMSGIIDSNIDTASKLAGAESHIAHAREIGLFDEATIMEAEAKIIPQLKGQMVFEEELSGIGARNKESLRKASEEYSAAKDKYGVERAAYDSYLKEVSAKAKRRNAAKATGGQVMDEPGSGLTPQPTVPKEPVIGQVPLETVDVDSVMAKVSSRDDLPGSVKSAAVSYATEYGKQKDAEYNQHWNQAIKPLIDSDSANIGDVMKSIISTPMTSATRAAKIAELGKYAVEKYSNEVNSFTNSVIASVMRPDVPVAELYKAKNIVSDWRSGQEFSNDLKFAEKKTEMIKWLDQAIKAKKEGSGSLESVRMLAEQKWYEIRQAMGTGTIGVIAAHKMASDPAQFGLVDPKTGQPLSLVMLLGNKVTDHLVDTFQDKGDDVDKKYIKQVSAPGVANMIETIAQKRAARDIGATDTSLVKAIRKGDKMSSYTSMIMRDYGTSLQDHLKVNRNATQKDLDQHALDFFLPMIRLNKSGFLGAEKQVSIWDTGTPQTFAPLMAMIDRGELSGILGVDFAGKPKIPSTMEENLNAMEDAGKVLFIEAVSKGRIPGITADNVKDKVRPVRDPETGDVFFNMGDVRYNLSSNADQSGLILVKQQSKGKSNGKTVWSDVESIDFSAERAKQLFETRKKMQEQNLISEWQFAQN